MESGRTEDLATDVLRGPFDFRNDAAPSVVDDDIYPSKSFLGFEKMFSIYSLEGNIERKDEETVGAVKLAQVVEDHRGAKGRNDAVAGGEGLFNQGMT